MSNSEPTLRTLSRIEILPRLSLVLASLSAAGWLAGFAVRTGSDGLMLASLAAVLGPLVGLKYIDREARKLEDDEGGDELDDGRDDTAGPKSDHDDDTRPDHSREDGESFEFDPVPLDDDLDDEPEVSDAD